MPEAIPKVALVSRWLKLFGIKSFLFSAVLSNSFSRARYPNSLPSSSHNGNLNLDLPNLAGTQYRALWSSTAEGPFADQLATPCRGLRRIALPSDLEYCHPLFREMMFESLIPELLLAATIDKPIDRHRVCENRPNMRLPVGIISSPRVDSVTGSLCSSR